MKKNEKLKWCTQKIKENKNNTAQSCKSQLKACSQQNNNSNEEDHSLSSKQSINNNKEYASIDIAVY